MREIVDLISSDAEADVEIINRPHHSPPRLTKRSNHVDFDVAELLDDDDDDFAWPIALPAKRRKIDIDSQCGQLLNTTRSTNGNVFKPQQATNKKTDHDEIIFTSSPARIARLHVQNKSDLVGSDVSDESPVATQKLDFSTRTAEILSQITVNKPKAKKASKKKAEIEAVSDGELPRRTSHDKPEKDNILAQKEERAAQRDKLREAKAAEKEKSKQERQEAKAAKAVEKQRAADIASVNRSKLDKKVTTPEMIVDFPLSMDGSSTFTSCAEFLREADAETSLYPSEIAGIIKFRRKIRADFNEEQGCFLPVPRRVDNEKIVLLFLLARDFARLVSPQTPEDETIEQRISHLRRLHPDHRSILLIEGLDALLAKEKNASTRAYQAAVRRIVAQETAMGEQNGDQASNAAETTRKRQNKAKDLVTVDEAAIEATLLTLQVKHSMQIHHCALPLDTGEAVLAMTQQISQSRYRDPPVLPPAQLAVQPNFCMATGQVATGKNVDDTYLKILQQVIRITEREATAIAGVYPTVGSLFRAFRSKGDRVLENIMKEGGGARGSANGTAAERRIGISASQRLARIFLSLEPGELVG